MEIAARIVECGLLEDPYRPRRPLTRPSFQDLHDRLRGCDRDFENAQANVGDYTIPCTEFLALVSATIRITNDQTDSRLVNTIITRPEFSVGGDPRLRMAIAEAALYAAGIEDSADITFADFDGLRRHFVSKKPEAVFIPIADADFVQEDIIVLWKALFRTMIPYRDPDLYPPPHRLPREIVRALDLFLPFDTSGWNHEERVSCTLTCTSRSTDGLLRKDVLGALTSMPWTHRMVIVYGTALQLGVAPRRTRYTRNDDRTLENGPISVFAIFTSSPLWHDPHGRGRRRGYVGSSHIIMEIAPRPRMLRFMDYDHDYTQIVDVTDDDKILFGYKDGASGLMLDFRTESASMRCAASQKRRGRSSYHGQYIGRRKGQIAAIPDAQRWESTMQISKIDVYQGNEGGQTN